jgi:hypothetical protein
MTQLFPRLPFHRENAGVSRLYLETEGAETNAIIRAKSLHPIDVGDALHFEIAVSVLNAPLEIYHGDRLIHTKSDSIGPLIFEYSATSTASYFEFRSEGEGSLVEMTWPSITKAA